MKDILNKIVCCRLLKEKTLAHAQRKMDGKRAKVLKTGHVSKERKKYKSQTNYILVRKIIFFPRKKY